MTASVVSLPARKSSTKAKAKAPAAIKSGAKSKILNTRTLDRAHLIATVVVAVVTLALGIGALQDGIATFTGAGFYASWGSAIMTDLAVVVAESAPLLAAGEAKRIEMQRLARPVVIGALLMSAAVNVGIHVYHAPNWWVSQVVAVAYGIFIPALYIGLSRILARHVKG